MVVHEHRALQSASEIRAQVNRVQEVMQAVMKKDTHYGTIPGCKQPSLYKAGSEVLLSTFRIAVSLRVEDLSTPDEIRYRVYAIGTHQATGIVMGEGAGECSSSEEKYKWRASICADEFNETPVDRRRVKYKKGGYEKGSWNKNAIVRLEQIRTEPADVANTVLKMAKKRAQIDMTLTTTAASDCFTQDIEDLPEELRESEDAQGAQNAEFARSVTPQSRSAKAEPKTVSGEVLPAEPKEDPPAAEGLLKIMNDKIARANLSTDDVFKKFQIATLEGVTTSMANSIIAWTRNPC
jgi:hypothetical protein